MMVQFQTKPSGFPSLLVVPKASLCLGMLLTLYVFLSLLSPLSSSLLLISCLLFLVINMVLGWLLCVPLLRWCQAFKSDEVVQDLGKSQVLSWWYYNQLLTIINHCINAFDQEIPRYQPTQSPFQVTFQVETMWCSVGSGMPFTPILLLSITVW